MCSYPPGATLDAEDSTTSGERWQMKTSYLDAVAQEQALLPVGHPLGDLPWCEETKMPPSTPEDETNWIWGTQRNGVIVSVFPLVADLSTIVVRRSDTLDMYCSA
jgi:hypothetical protein